MDSGGAGLGLFNGGLSTGSSATGGRIGGISYGGITQGSDNNLLLIGLGAAIILVLVLKK